jgi:hypothetical protein
VGAAGIEEEEEEKNTISCFISVSLCHLEVVTVIVTVDSALPCQRRN